MFFDAGELPEPKAAPQAAPQAPQAPQAPEPEPEPAPAPAPEPARAPTPEPPLGHGQGRWDLFLRELRTVFTFGYTFEGVRAPLKHTTARGDEFVLREPLTEPERQARAVESATQHLQNA